MKEVYCYFGHHKCASTWIIGILYDLCSVLGLRILEKQSIKVTDLNAFVMESKIDFYVSQTSCYSKINLVDFKGFHVIRDPRDIIVSGYFSHLYSHSVVGWSELQDHRIDLQKLDKRAGLLNEIIFSKQFIDHMSAWNYNDPRILELKMEDLTLHPVKGFIKICKFLEIYKEEQDKIWIKKVIALLNKLLRKTKLNFKISSDGISLGFLEYLLQKHSFKNLSGGREIGNEDQTSHYRKGLSGDWRNHFEDVHKMKFKEVYGNLLVRLGYELNNNW